MIGVTQRCEAILTHILPSPSIHHPHLDHREASAIDPPDTWTPEQMKATVTTLTQFHAALAITLNSTWSSVGWIHPAAGPSFAVMS